MSGIVFEPDLPIAPPEPARSDVACFVGLVRLAPGAAAAQSGSDPLSWLPASQLAWLREQGWTIGPNARDARSVSTLVDLPVPVQNFAAFQALFDDGSSSAAVGTDYLAVAVRSFFAQGGTKAYVVRMGDPLAPSGDTTGPGVIDALLGRDPVSRIDANPGDPASFHGIAHLWGLADVSFVLLPDLPLLYAEALALAQGTPVDPSKGPEGFVECLPDEVELPAARVFPLPAPRLTQEGYTQWGKTILRAVRFLGDGGLKEVQLVAALPLPAHASAALASEQPPAEVQAGDVHAALDAVFPEITADSGISPSSALLQLAYPWLRSTRSAVLLEGCEPPDGTLAGILARNALARGAFTSATKITPADVIDVTPELPASEITVPVAPYRWGPDAPPKPLITRVSLFGFTPQGIRLLSDVTAYPGEAYRPARVNRLVSVISRSARHFGQNHVFAANGPALWAELAHTLRQLMTRLFSLGALDGESPADAYDVRCDRSTMTQNDIDNGRLIANVSFHAAAVIELIRVTLSVATGGSPAQIEAQRLGGV